MSDKNALVFGDSATQRYYLQQLLCKDGFYVQIATDGESAMDIAYTEQLDLIILDAVMPAMDGFNICRLIKADAKTKNIPVIIISSKDNQRNRTRALLVGAQAYISKANARRDLLECIDRLTNKQCETDNSMPAPPSV